MENKQSQYSLWEQCTTMKIEEKLGVTTSDAQGIMEAQDFYLTQCWANNLMPEDTAKVIIEKATSRKPTA